MPHHRSRWFHIDWSQPLTAAAPECVVATLDVDPRTLPWQTIEVDTTGWPQEVIDAATIDPFTRRRLTGR